MRIENNVIVELNLADSQNNTLTIPKNAVDIDVFAEEGNWLALNECKKIIVEEGNAVFQVKNGCLINSKTKTLICGLDNSVIPADGNIDVIGNYAFNMRNMNEIKIPDGVKEIGYMSFASTNADRIYISKSVERISPRAFALNSNTDLIVDSNNHCFFTQSGCLIERNTNKLIASFGENVIIPDCVKSIDDFFFLFADHKTITVPSSVTEISENAFDMCQAEIIKI